MTNSCWRSFSGGAIGAAHGVVKAPQLALGAGIHVAHAADDAVRLVVEIQAVGDQLLELDLGRTFEAVAIAAAAVVAAVAASAVIPARATARLRPSRGPRALACLPWAAAIPGSSLPALVPSLKPRSTIWPTARLPDRPAAV